MNIKCAKTYLNILMQDPTVKDVYPTRKSGTSYEVEMSDEEHIKLVNTLLNFKGKVLVSGYNHEIYNRLSDSWGRLDFNSPNSGSSSVESLWKNF